MTTQPDDTSPSQPPHRGWLWERRYKLWGETLGLRLVYWLVFSAGVALAPIGIAVITSTSGGKLIGEIPSAVANGEIFLIGTAIAAPALGDIMMHRNKANPLICAAAVALASMTILFSAALFGSVSGHNQETRNDQVASERVIGIALQSAIKNKDKKPTGVVSVQLNPVDVGKYLEAHEDDTTLKEGKKWPQPNAVASRSFYLLVAALLAGISGVLIAEAKPVVKDEPTP